MSGRPIPGRLACGRSVHVDGASGGFLAPFIDPDLVWDFRLPRIKSINTSGHKFGQASLMSPTFRFELC